MFLTLTIYHVCYVSVNIPNNDNDEYKNKILNPLVSY